MQPLNDRVLVKLDKVPEKTPGGIYLPDQAKEIAFEGEVIAAGKEVKEIKVGDRVFIGKYAGVELKVDDEPHLMLKEEDILAKV